MTDELLSVWVEHAGRCLPHFHLPLQSGDDGVLRRMGRRYDTRFYTGLVSRLRSAIPGVAVHADVIVGFPTEDDAAWERSAALIAGLELAGIHVFRYSERPGTPAVRMAGQVPESARKQRASELFAHAADRRAAYVAQQVGRAVSVLFEQRLPDGRWMGHAENNVPVATSALPGDGGSLENALATVAIRGVDVVADRVTGLIVKLQPASRPRSLPVVAPERLRPVAGFQPALQGEFGGG